MMDSFYKDNKIILYDGVCVLCNKWVNFIIKNDKNEIFKFSPLQSKTSKKILKSFKIPNDNFDTIYIIKDGEIFTKFKASTYALYNVNKVFIFLYFLNFIFPKFFLDFFYDFVGSKRYRLFGKLENCPVPHPSIKKRFLND